MTNRPLNAVGEPLTLRERTRSHDERRKGTLVRQVDGIQLMLCHSVDQLVWEIPAPSKRRAELGVGESE